MKLFWKVRDHIIREPTASTDEIIRAIDAGITVLKAIDGVPLEKNIVYHPGVTIYRDNACKLPISDAKAVLFDTQSPGGTSTNRRSYPTTKTYYKKGMQVSWEWNMGKVFPESWYRDLDSNEIVHAWLASAEFVGRPLSEV